MPSASSLQPSPPVLHCIGLISGTSMDAIDAALVAFTDSGAKPVSATSWPLEEPVQRQLRALGPDAPLREVAALDRRLGHMFAQAALAVLKRSGMRAAQVTAIGSHGQTVLHGTEDGEPCTVQIGDPNIIALQTGMVTVADFRRMDLAAGGEGAPLAPAFHAWQFGDTSLPQRSIVNIGGMANLTVLPGKGSGGDVVGFDTGPGNVLLDEWIRHCRDLPMDRDGAWAATGKAREPLLQQMLTDEYFSRPPPKSTGRERFNLSWLQKHLDNHNHKNGVAPQDIQATLLRLSVETIAGAVRRHAPSCSELLVCGGGMHNREFMQVLAAALPGLALYSTGQRGLEPDYVEAVAFAWLARRRILALPGNLPSVTGARRSVLLGGIYDPHSGGSGAGRA